jgi:hypothetical protein
LAITKENTPLNPMQAILKTGIFGLLSTAGHDILDKLIK